MTAKGSVTPGRACGSRPVESSTTLGGFPDSRHVPKAWGQGGMALYPLGPPPPTAGWQFSPAEGGETRSTKPSLTTFDKLRANGWCSQTATSKPHPCPPLEQVPTAMDTHLKQVPQAEIHPTSPMHERQ